MRVLDSHTHAWTEPSRDHPWTNGMLTKLADSYSTDLVYSAEKLRTDMNAEDVDEAVVSPFPLDNWEDSGWYVSQIVGEFDNLYGIVLLDIFAEDAADQLRAMMAADGVIGLRIGTNFPRDREKQWDNDYLDPDADWLYDFLDDGEDFWEAAVETDAHVELHTTIHQFDQVEQVVESYPELTFTIDHLGFLTTEIPPSDEDFQEYDRLADHDNVAVKIAGVPLLSNDEYPYEDLHGYVRWFLDNLGKERVVWGSDWPNMSQVTTYSNSLSWVEEIDGVTEEEYRWMTERSFKNLVSL